MKKLVYLLLVVSVVFSCKKKENDPTPTPVDPLGKAGAGVYDVDSNFYKTVVIKGSGEWMAEDLRTSHFSNNDTIPSGKNITDISGFGSPKFFFYPNGDSTVNLKKYGRLYTYFVVEDGRNVCPTGWHVPSYAEFDTLTIIVGGQEKGGGKLKATNLWASPNTGADNESLFTGLPAGFREPENVYPEVTKTGIWWTTTPEFDDRIWAYYLKYSYAYVFRSGFDKKNANAIRCKRD